MLGERGMVQKRCFYEWSCRIPLMIYVPDAPSKRVGIPVSLVDLGSTILHLAGSEMYETDGYNIYDVEFREPIFSESHGEGVLWPCYMVRDNNYKYTYIYKREEQLFDLDNDPDERFNLAYRSEFKAVK
jgi:choline-sulfatase